MALFRNVHARIVAGILAVVLVTAIVTLAAVSRSWKANDEAGSKKTSSIIRCIAYSTTSYQNATGTLPTSIDECLSVAVSDRYCYEPFCTTEGIKQAILARRDGWDRQLEFEQRPVGNNLIEVTVISWGANGKREYSGTGAFGDDLTKTFYIQQPKATK